MAIWPNCFSWTDAIRYGEIISGFSADAAAVDCDEHWKAIRGRRPLSYIFCGVSLAGVSCRRRWSRPTTLALTMLLG